MRRLTGVLGIVAGCAVVAFPAAAQEDGERCYGVAPAGANDGLADEASGGSTLDYQGDAWSWVERGSCLTLPLPPQPDGTPRRGSYEPLARDRPR